MVRTKLFKHTFLLLFAIGVADFVANSLYLYWTVWWFDMVMHFSSGFCVGMATVLLWQYFVDKNVKFDRAIKIALLSVFAVGIAWEVFESYFQIMLISDGMPYITDTISDLILDVTGGLLGSIYAYRLIFNK